jgi:hypothetical protein
MIGSLLGWAGLIALAAVLYWAACRPTVPADKPRHWSLDRPCTVLPRRVPCALLDGRRPPDDYEEARRAQIRHLLKEESRQGTPDGCRSGRRSR